MAEGGSEIKSKTDKHVFAVSGKTRHRSEELQSNNKRGRKSSTEYLLLDQDASSDSSEEDTNQTKNEQQNFVSNMEMALSNGKVAALLVGLFEKSVSQRLNTISDRLAVQEEAGTERDSRLDNIETKIEEYEQQRREKNIIITGLNPNKTTREDVKKFLNDKLDMKAKLEDIVYTLKLSKEEGQTTPCRVRAVFTTKEMKDRVIKKKQLLKGQKVWITDDLTPYRERLSYMCRQSVKQKRAEQTWTYDGKIYIKMTKDARPHRIDKPEEIP